MMMLKRKWRFAAPILLLALPLLAAIILVCYQIRQDNLDHALIKAVKDLDAPSVTRLLDQGANANAYDSSEPPLTLLSLLKHLWLRIQNKKVASDSSRPALRLLLSDKRLVTYPDKSQIRLYRVEGISNNAPASSFAPTFDTISIALIQHGANTHIAVKDNKTPLHIAALYGLHESTRILASDKATVNAKDDFGMTLLMCADSEDTALLLGCGADINAKNTRGETPLVYNLYRATPAQIKLMIENGADVNMSNGIGHSPLYIAMVVLEASPHKSEVLRILTQQGARLNNKDRAFLAAQNR